MPNPQRKRKKTKQEIESCLRTLPQEQIAEAEESLHKARLQASIIQQSKALGDKDAASPITKFLLVWGRSQK